jgi:sirohydrochlorin cobaltochelatase
MENSIDDSLMETVAFLVHDEALLQVDGEVWERIAERLSDRLGHPVLSVRSTDPELFSEQVERDLQWYSELGYQRFVYLPISTQPLSIESIREALVWVRSQDKKLAVYLGECWSMADWADALAPAMESALASHARSADERASSSSGPVRSEDVILLIGSGINRQPNVGAELATLAHHLVQNVANAKVEFCFTSRLVPSYASVRERMQRDQARCILLPWRMGIDSILPDCSASAWYCDFASNGEGASVELLEQPSIIHVLMDKYLGALQTRSVERYVRSSSNTVSTDEPSAQRSVALRALDQQIDAMLPSEYQGKTDDVSPQSMGSASIKLDEQGRVAWDEIWTSFCDLALAGGPPHRGKLLEAVTSAEVLEQREKYEEVVAEIRRGIEMVTGLKTHESKTLGWVGVECNDEPMACWLLRAIIVENVMVRREGSVLYLPAGPQFTIKREIKNVITSVAKTVHYWKEHKGG